MPDPKTDADKGQGELNFTKEQQAFIDKLMDKARIGAREKAQTDAAEAAKVAKDAAEKAKLEADAQWQKLAARHETRVKELEPFEAQAKAYVDLIDSMLKDKIKELGDAAKKAVAGLPESLTAIEKLVWLNQNEDLFKEAGPHVLRGGSPATRRKLATKAEEKPKRRVRKTL